jgi:hypothetical protein
MDLAQLLQTLFLAALGLTVLVLAGWLLGYALLILYRFRDREERSLKFVTLQVTVPRDNEIKIDAAEQMFTGLSVIHKSGFRARFSMQDHISLEIIALPEDIKFYISAPVKFRDLMEKQINGGYPDAEIKEVPEPNIFSEEGKVAFAQLQLKNAEYNPIQVYKNLTTDPLSAITTALGKLQPGEGAAIQIIVSPTGNSWRSRGRRFLSKTKKSESDPDKATFKMDAKTLEAIENKISKPGFEVAVRIVVSSSSVESAKAHLTNIKAAFEQFGSDLNGFKNRKIRLKALFVSDFIYRYQPMFHFFANKTILNTEELATIWHLPNKTVTTPHIFWLNSKRAPAPAQIPMEGLYLGKSTFRGLQRPVYIQQKDRQRHMYIIGKTGTGKSWLMRDMIMQDIREGKGVCFIDPHDTIDQILEMIPPERAEDVIYFNPADWERPIGFNLLEAKNEQEQHFVATGVINLMYKLYDPYKTGIVGPRFEHGIRNAMLTVMAEPGNTFVEVVRAMTDPAFVQELLPKVNDPMVRRYWTDQIAQTADFHKSEVLDYTVSKFGRFVTNKLMRNIIGQSHSSFDFRKVMDEGRILLIHLPKGAIGEENVSFLGLVLVPKILMAAMSREDIPEEQRRDFYLYVDEFQNFATPDFAQILSEARKYHLNLIVANQFIGQMEDEVKNAVFGNVGTQIAFRLGTADANYMVHEFQPVFTEADLLNVEAYHAFIKTIVNNEPVQPFSLDLSRNAEEIEQLKQMRNPEVAKAIKELSRLKFGRDVVEVEEEIARRARL